MIQVEKNYAELPGNFTRISGNWFIYIYIYTLGFAKVTISSGQKLLRTYTLLILIQDGVSITM